MSALIKKNVVIVGGGGAGAKVARALSEQLDRTKHNLLLISAHPYYIHYPAGIRMIVTADGSLEKRALISYDNLFVKGNGRFQQGKVTEIQAEKDLKKGGKVVLENGESIDYDALVLAPGSQWETFLDFPSDGKEAQAHIDEWRKKFKGAKKIAIAGGGAVGIELAGELKEFYPDKAVTIVHSDKLLLNDTYPPKFRKDVARRLRKLKVQVILDDFIDTFWAWPATKTRNGAALDADLVITARGGRPNTEFIASSLGPDTLTKKGLVRIKPTMQLADYPSIFAAGDITDIAEQKMVGKYPGHASIVAPNIVSLVNGAEVTKEYKGSPEFIFITLGKRRGAGFFGALWNPMFGNRIVSMLKSKNLFVDLTRKNMGYTS